MARADDYRRESRARWGAAATGWERRRDAMRRITMPVSAWMVDAIDPQPGQTVLEVAAGPGDTGFLAAELIQPGGTLITSDFAPEMLTVAQRRAEELGITNVRFKQIDAESIDLDAGTIDGVLGRWGYMLMADRAAAVRETRRVLRDGGAVSFSVWGAPEDNQWASAVSRILMQRGHMEPPESDAPGIFALSDPARIQQLFGDAGFGPPQLEEVRVTWRFDDFEHFWRYTNEIAGAVAMVIRQLDEREQAEVRRDLETALDGFKVGDGYEMPGVCINGLAR